MWSRLHIGQRLQQWLESRLPRQDTVELTQRNVYILPTGAGWMLAATLLVLLVASINYQLNLGYLVTFLLTGCSVVGMHVCHANLRGLAMHLIAPHAALLRPDADFSSMFWPVAWPLWRPNHRVQQLWATRKPLFHPHRVTTFPARPPGSRVNLV